MQEAFDFIGICFGMLPTDSFPGDFAGHLMQFQCDSKPLLTGHAAVSLDLFFQCGGRIHDFSISQFMASHNFKSASVTAPEWDLFCVGQVFQSAKGVGFIHHRWNNVG